LNAPHGLAQLTEHGVNYAANRLLPANSGLRQSINATTTNDDTALAQREAAYQTRTDGRLGSYGGAIVGEVLPWMTGVGEARALGLLPKAPNLLQKGALLTGEGALMGAATPVTNGDNYAGQKSTQVELGAGTALGLGVLAKAPGVLRYATDAGRDAIAAQRLGKMLDRAGADVTQLRQPAAVQGYRPSIAQASPSGEMLALERSLRNDKAGAGPAFVD
jgi:hypothetical protein